jgi:hypothetical protein
LTTAVAVLFLALPAGAADVTGRWIFEVELDIGSGSPTFVFEQDGESLTGTYSGRLGEAKLKGTAQGDQIQFGFDTSYGAVKYEGTIEGPNNMKGTADYAGQASGTWTAERAE